MNIPSLKVYAARSAKVASETQLRAGDEKAKVFISYSRKDLAFVDRLVSALEGHGIEPAIDRTDIKAGDEWWKRIEALISAADTIVFVLSPDSVTSGVCKDEVAFAVAQEKRLMPIVARSIEIGSVPPDLAKLNFILFDDPKKFDVSIAQLIEALSTNFGWVRQHTAFGLNAQAWEKEGRPSGLLLRSPRLEEAELWVSTRPHGAPLPTELTQAFIRESRQAATRRRNILTGSLAAGLIVALALAGLALWQREIAVEQTKRANQNFAAAKDAADKLIINMARKLRDVRGISQEITLIVLSPAETVMNKLVANSEESTELLLSRITLFEEFSRTYFYVGDILNSRKYVEQSIDLNNRLIGSTVNPARRAELLQHRCDELMIEGDVLRVLGELDVSLKTFQMAKDSAEEIIALKPSQDKQTWRQLAQAHGRIGDVMRTAGRFAEASQEYDASKIIQTRFHEKNRDDSDWLSDLSWSHNRYGDNLLQITNHEGLMTVSADRTPRFKEFSAAAAAIEHYESGLKIRRDLMLNDLRSNDRRRNFVWSAALTGMALLAANTKQARDVLDEGLKEANALLAGDPKNTEWLRYKALIHNFRGDALLLENHVPEAFVEYDRGLAIRKQLTDTDSANARWARDFFYTLERMFEMYRVAGNLEKAEDYRGLAQESAKRVSRDFPTDAVLARTVARLKD